ncbi:hypothetical protein H4I95_07854 [Botrytis cinerea]
MSRFHSSSSTGSAPGAASSNSTNTSAPRGRGYQVPQTSNSLHSPIIHPLHVPYVCDQQMELSLDPPNIHPPSNRPGNLSSSTTSASTQAKKTKKNSPLSLRLLSSSSSASSSSNYSDSCGSYESIDWSALEIKPHPMAPKPYRSPTMYSESIQEEHTSSNFSTGSSEDFPIGSPCINVGLLLDVKAPPPRPYVEDDPSDPFLDHPNVQASPPKSIVADEPSDCFLAPPLAFPPGLESFPLPPTKEMILEEQTIASRAHIITPVRPLSQSPMATSDSGCEIIAQSPLSDPFCLSQEPSPSPVPIPSPVPSPSPRSQDILRGNFGRFHDARPLPPPPMLSPMVPTVTYTSSSSSSSDESDTTAGYPSSLDDDPLDTPEPETTPWTIAPVQSWMSRNSSTIKTVATWTLVAAAIILPKILWKCLQESLTTKK